MNKKMQRAENGHSSISSLLYFISLMYKASPLFVILDLSYGILEILPTQLISVLGIKYIIDVMTSGERLYRISYGIIAICIITVLTKTLAYLYREFFFNPQKEKLGYKFNRMLYEKSRSLDLESYDNPEFYNSFILTIEASSDGIQNLMFFVRRVFGQVVTLVTIATVILTIDPVCLAIIIVPILLFYPISGKLATLRFERRIENNKLHRRADYFQRIYYLQDYAKEVRMNGISPILLDRYNEAADDIIDNHVKYVSKIISLSFVQEFGTQIISILFFLPLYIGYMILVKKTLGAGDFVATFNAAASIAGTLNFLLTMAPAVLGERAKTIEKYREFMKADFNIKDGEKTAPCAKPETIEIKNLSFTYPGNDHATINNVSLKIEPYEKIALVGYNGAGKTTLTNLLLRLYDVTEGSVEIGGEDIRNVTTQSHRDRFAAVFQDFQTFACNVGENVALSDEYDSGRVMDSLKHSGFSKAIKNGTETELLREFDDEGVMLSGGESQKVAIARAFYKNCPYVILDEPSANLDPIAEYNLNQAMMEVAKNKTVIFISHRLSTTVNADRIYVMENGSIIESGSHAELMAKNGTYAYMFNLQAEKYKQG